MNRTPELEAMLSADETAVSNKHVKRNQLLGMSALLLSGAVAAYFVLAAPQERPRDVTDGRTTTFRPPSFVREEEKPEPAPDNNVINLPPPPEVVEEVDTTEFKVPPPPEAIETTPEAAPPAEEFPARFKSGLITLDAKKGDDGAGT